jgi:hypothetical protein
VIRSAIIQQQRISALLHFSTRRIEPRVEVITHKNATNKDVRTQRSSLPTAQDFRLLNFGSDLMVCRIDRRSAFPATAYNDGQDKNDLIAACGGQHIAHKDPG